MIVFFNKTPCDKKNNVKSKYTIIRRGRIRRAIKLTENNKQFLRGLGLKI